MKKTSVLFLATVYFVVHLFANFAFAQSGPAVYPWSVAGEKPVNCEGSYQTPAGSASDLPADTIMLLPSNFSIENPQNISASTRYTWVSSSKQNLRGNGLILNGKIVVPQGKSGDYQIAGTFLKTGTDIYKGSDANWSGKAVTALARTYSISVNDKYIGKNGSLKNTLNYEDTFVLGYDAVWGTGSGYLPETGVKYGTGFFNMSTTRLFWDWSPIITLKEGINNISITLNGDCIFDAIMVTKVGEEETLNNSRGFDWTRFVPEYTQYNTYTNLRTVASTVLLPNLTDETVPVMESGTLQISDISDKGAFFTFPLVQDDNFVGYQLCFTNTLTGEKRYVSSFENSVMVSILSSGSPYDVSVAGYDKAGNASEVKTASFVTTGEIGVDHYFLTPESFSSSGTWTMEADSLSLEGYCLRGLTNQKPATSVPAVSKIEITQTDIYYIWAHSKDFPEDRPGIRNFQLGVNGQTAPVLLGKHGLSGYAWELVGSFALNEGENEISLIDTTAHYPRCDGIFITRNSDLIPPDTYNALCQIVMPYSIHNLVDKNFPQWANSGAAPTATATIQNDKTKVIFYEVPTEHGKVIQNEIYVYHDGVWVKTNKRDENLGYLVLRANTSAKYSRVQDMLVFNNSYPINGTESTYMGINIFKAGEPIWMIPNDFEPYSENGIRLNFGNDRIGFSATWELEEDESSPKVTLNATFNEAGSYSIGVFEGKSFNDEDYEFAMAPFRVMGKRISEKQGLILEQYAFTPMGTITLPKNNEYIADKNVTKGVVVEPSWIPLRWVYTNNSMFGIGMRDWNSKVAGSIFAPLFGSDDSIFSAGDCYEFSYRVINDIGNWFESYKHVSEGLYGFGDYRQNYYHSLNEAIYNTTKLMKDDIYSGWDPYAKAYYNMEGKNAVSIANTMQSLSSYLLTEDEEMLEKRALPTLAYFLSRRNVHFNRTDEKFGGQYFLSQNVPYPVGAPIPSMLNTAGGIFEQTLGLMPEVLNYSRNRIGALENQYETGSNFIMAMDMYVYTKDPRYLEIAKRGADRYLENVVFAPQTTPIEWNLFIYISYYPSLSALLDIYELTGEPRYLEGAREVGQWISGCVWVPGIDGNKANQMMTVNESDVIKAVFHYGSENNDRFWFYGDQQFRIGTPKGDPGYTVNILHKIDNQREVVPAWVPSRVGLGVEQASTFAHSSNIIMSSWAGDMVKLSKYTGDTYFENVARNAIVGRFGNYSGYYQNSFMTYHQKDDFPYEGPDYTGIYWHHLPPFLAMLQDFLINQVWSWSEDNIWFPSVRQQGYAYFTSNQFGHAPGRFFDQTDMWLWLDEGIIIPESIQIDYITARKDGVLGLAMLNEASEPVTSEIALGEKVEGGSIFNGWATIYAPDGTTTKTSVQNGKFTITIPAKSLRAAVIEIEGVKAPAFSGYEYDVTTNQVGQTVYDHQRGKGYVLQVSKDFYHAYVYVTDMPVDTASVKINYKIGAKPVQTLTTDEYPFEFIIKVDHPGDTFRYDLEITKKVGNTVPVSGGSLRAINSDADICGVTPDRIYHRSELPLEIVFGSGQAALDGQSINSGYKLLTGTAKAKDYTLSYTDTLGKESVAFFRITDGIVTIDSMSNINNEGTRIWGLKNHSDLQQNFMILVAAYQGNRLVTYKMINRTMAPNTKENVDIIFDSPPAGDGLIYKYFIWDTINGLKPLL